MCVNNYIIHRTINSGSYATIRKAYDTLDNEYVALRIVNRRTMAKKFGVQMGDSYSCNYLNVLNKLYQCRVPHIIRMKQFLYKPVLIAEFGADDSPVVPITHEM